MYLFDRQLSSSSVVLLIVLVFDEECLQRRSY